MFARTDGTMNNPVDILAELDGHPRTEIRAGDVIFEQGAHSGFLVFLIEGGVEVVKDGMTVDHETRPGSVYGEISILLGNPHMAQVKAASDSVIVKIEDPMKFFVDHPVVTLHVCRTIAERLTAATRYLVDFRRQFSKDDTHLEMMDKILTMLIHRNPKSATDSRTEPRPDH